jgi:hypothetical protein
MLSATRSLPGLLALFLVAGTPAFASLQGIPDQDDKKKAVEAREKRAQDLLDAAQKLETEGKLPEALAKYREFRDRYRMTAVYTKNFESVADKLVELGRKVAVALLSKQTPAKKPHMDSWYAYEFNPPDKWRGVPPAQGFKGDQDTSEVNYQGQIIRITRYTSPFLERLYLQVLKLYACSSLMELQTKITGFLEERYKGLKEESSSILKGRYEIQRKVYVTDDGDRIVVYPYFAEKRGLALVGIWRAGAGDDSFGTFIIVSGGTTRTIGGADAKPVEASDFEQALKVLDQSARTFVIYDAPTRSARAVQLNRGARCADWNLLRTKNYDIEYATTPEFAKKLGDEMEQIMGLYRMVIPTQKAIERCRIKVFDTKEDFQYYGMQIGVGSGAAAYWSPGQEEVVCYRFTDKKVTLDSEEEMTIAEESDPEEVTFKIIYHEGFHQYMHFTMGMGRGVYVPSWLNEGMGDYFFGGEWNKQKTRFTIGPNDWRVKTITEAVKANKHVPLKQIFRYTKNQYYANAGLCYAEGWSINYFFLTSEVGKKKGYNQIPNRMFQELKQSGDFMKATDKVFAGIDLAKMEEEWKEFVNALPVPGAKPAEPAPADEKKAPPDPKKGAAPKPAPAPGGPAASP